MSMQAFAGAVSLAIVFFQAGPGMAANMSALTGAEIEAALSEAGLDVEMLEDAASGNPVANAVMGDIRFWVRALDCADGACSTLVFFANFSLGRPVEDSDYRIINRFNDRNVFGRAFVLDSADEVGVDYVIELDGGVSMDNVSANISRWADVISAFIDHFRAGAGSS